MLREATADDLPFLWEMLGTAAAPGGDPIPVADLRQIDELARYLDGWGRPGDLGLVVVGDDDPAEVLGAGWYRCFPTDDPGYGFVDPQIPELATAIRPGARGLGLGHRLIDALLAAGADAGFEQLSLSVLVDNVAAIKVYEDCGFVFHHLEPDGEAQTMVAPTRPERSID